MVITISKKIIFIFLFIFLMAVGIFIYFNYLQVKSLVPKDVESKIDFSYVLPKKDFNNQVDVASFKFDDKEKIFSYIYNFKNNKFTFAEQTYPEILIYDKLVNSMGLYSEFTSKLGKVSLTKLKNGNQVGVININNANTSLIFITSSADLSDDSWKNFVNTLEIVN